MTKSTRAGRITDMKKAKGDLLERLVPVLLFASIALAFVVGILWQKVSGLEGGGGVTTGTTAGGVTGADAQQAAEGTPTSGKLSEERAKTIPAISDDDHIRGNRDAQVYLIEYSDFECPFCSRFHPTTKQVLDEYGDKVAVVYRHFPLDQIHPKARPAAEASECIAELGGNDVFWNFVDEVFENQATALGDLEATASKVGVSASAFKSCVDSGKYAKSVEDEYQNGLSAGVTGTPGNFVVNKKGEAWFLPGAYPFEQFKSSIDEALQS